MNNSFITYNQDFQLFGNQHVVMLVLALISAILLPFLSKKYLNKSQQLWVSRSLTILISFWALIYVVLKWWLGDFNYKTDLPLDICNVIALLLPFLMWNPSYRVHEIIYFWVLAGTMQAIITPHLVNGFPNYIFFKYWFVHAGLVVFVIYSTTVFNLQPTLKSVWKSFIALQFYVLFIYLINLSIGSNYVYIMEKPPVPSALDYLGPWPYYLIVCEVIAILIFWLLYLPIYFTAEKKQA